MQVYSNSGEIKSFDPKSENVIIRDSVSKKEVRVDNKFRSCRAVTEAMINLYRSAFNINIVNFYVWNIFHNFFFFFIKDSWKTK